MRFFRRRFEPLDGHTLERVVKGDRDVPAEARPLARLLRAAAAPAYPEELRDEHVARAAFRVARANPLSGQPRSTRSVAALSRLLSMKVLAVILGTAATAGGVAFAANNGVLPDMLTPGDSATSTSAKPSNRGTKPPGGPTSHRGSTGVDVAPATIDRLCVAYLAKEKAERDKALDTVEYQPLVQVAGGANKVTSYCEKLVREQASRGPGNPGSTGGPGNNVNPGDPGHPGNTANPGTSARSDKPPARRTASPDR